MGGKILNKMGIKTETTKDSIKIYGNPNLINKKTIKNYLKDQSFYDKCNSCFNIWWKMENI